MIGTLRKHSQAMWWVIIVAIIITFVWWGSQSPNADSSGGAGNYGIMNGQVITPTLLDNVSREVRLSFFYSNNGRWPEPGQTPPDYDIERECYQRLLLVQKVAELGIHVSDEAVAQAANARMSAVNRGNPVALADFEKQLLAPKRLTIGDFERFIRNDLAIQQLVSVVGAGGELVAPQDVETLYRREFQEVSTQLVPFRATTNLTSIAAPADKVGEFYTNRMAAYRLPDRVQINFVSYPLSNFIAAAKAELDKNTNMTEIIEARYEQLGTNYFAEAKSPTEAKQMIRDEFERNIALNNAAKEAKKFDAALYEKSENGGYKNDLYITVAKEMALTPQVSAPFSINEPPAGLDVSEDFVRRAFNLSTEEPLTEPLAGQDHVYVIGFNRLLPSENPTFESIRDRVIQDYRFTEAATKAQEAAVAFHATATNGLAAGQTFDAICTKAGVKPITLEPFSPSSRTIPEVENMVDPRYKQQFLQFFRRVAFGTTPGQVGSPLPSSDGAAVLFVQARLPINEAAMRTNLPAFTRSVQQMRRGEVFNEWFNQQANTAFATIPYFQKKAQMSSNPAGN
jgi:parvulin-like peptidyl-prolyl isomerase